MHAEQLQYGTCVPSLVSIAEAVFLLDKQTNRQTDKQTRLNALPTPGNKSQLLQTDQHDMQCYTHRVVHKGGRSV